MHLRAAFAPLRPGVLDAPPQALAGDGMHCVSGVLGPAHGRAVPDPRVVLTGEGGAVPDLAPWDGDATLPVTAVRPAGPVTAVPEATPGALADAAHRGLRALSPAARATRATAPPCCAAPARAPRPAWWTPRPKLWAGWVGTRPWSTGWPRTSV